MSVKPIPEGFHSVTPSMTVKNGAEAIDFYKKAFGAEEVMRINGPGGSVVHAEIKVGNSIIMIGEEWPGHHVQAPPTVGGTTMNVHVYLNDVDAAHKRAVEAGATELMPPTDMFWGDRFSNLKDPYGHAWSLGTHTRDLSPEDCQKACDDWMAKMASGEVDPC